MVFLRTYYQSGGLTIVPLCKAAALIKKGKALELATNKHSSLLQKCENENQKVLWYFLSEACSIKPFTDVIVAVSY
jgi:hypothetical protein